MLIESDCKAAVDVVMGIEDYLGTDVSVVAECKLLALDFASIGFAFCPREPNEVANSLAKHSYCTRSSNSWDTTPDFY